MDSGRRVGAEDCTSPPLTEPDLRASHTALWIDMSERPDKLPGRLYVVVEFVPSGGERYQLPGEPGWRVGARQSRVPPIQSGASAASGIRRPVGRLTAGAAGLQVPVEETGSFPLADDDRPETAADMGIDDLQCPDGFRGTQAEVRPPSVQVAAEVLHAGGERTSPIGRRPLPHRGSQPPFRLRRQ